MRNSKHSKKNNIFYDKYNHNNQNIEIQSYPTIDISLIDNVDQKLLELLVKGYENKKIAAEVKTPLSTIQRRVRKIFDSQYITRKNELNHKKLGLRKGYLQISLKGDKSYEVAQKLADMNGIISVSGVMGNDFDILCTCIFKNTDELFSLIENIKTVERIDKVAWLEEVRSIETEDKIAPFGVRIL